MEKEEAEVIKRDYAGVFVMGVFESRNPA